MTHQIGVRILLILNHILAVIGIIYSPLPWYLWIPIGFLLFGKFGSEIGNHRYVAHNSFETGPIRHFLLSTLGIFNCYGSPISWAIAHRAHHMNSDEELDPHSPHIISWWRVWLTLWRKVNLPIKHYADLLKDPIYKKSHKYYFYIIGITFLLLSLIDWRLPVFLISIPSVGIIHGAALVNIVCHKWGYRNFETTDKSTNNTLGQWLSGFTGSMLHNNHHYDPSAYNTKMSDKWYETDFLNVFIIEKFLRKI